MTHIPDEPRRLRNRRMLLARAVLFGVKLSLSVGAVAAVYYVQRVAEPEMLPEVSFAHRLRSTCPALGSDEFYFEVGTFPRFDRFARAWASAHLAMAAQESLSCGAALSSETLRLTWLRTDHEPIVVRVDRSHGGVHATAIALQPSSDPRHPAPQSILWRLDQQIADRAFVDLESALARAGVWSVPDSLGDATGGAEWVVERRRGSTYNAAHRFTPGPGPFRDACVLFLKVADLRIPADEIY
jgi:hypothetical protein